MNPEDNSDLEELRQASIIPENMHKAFVDTLRQEDPLATVIRTGTVPNPNSTVRQAMRPEQSSTSSEETEWLKYEEVPSFTYNEWRRMHGELSNELDQSSRMDGTFGPAIMVSTVVASNLLTAVEQALGIQKGAAFRPPKDGKKFTESQLIAALGRANDTVRQVKTDPTLWDRVWKAVEPWIQAGPGGVADNETFIGMMLILHELRLIDLDEAPGLKIP